METSKLRRSTTISALMLAGVLASPALVHAQANPTSDDTPAVTDTTTVTDRDDHGNWGWLGLLGLAGLLGLKRPERDITREQVRTRHSV
jgi:MYXO-CTERM domain-containing protein